MAHKALFSYICEGPKWHSDFMVLNVWCSERNSRPEDYFPEFFDQKYLYYSNLKIKIEKFDIGHVLT